MRRLSLIPNWLRRLVQRGPHPVVQQQAEEKLRLVVESAPNALIMTDGQGRMVLVNAQAEKLFGYSRQELMGMSVEMLVPDRFRPKHSSYRHGFMGQPQTRPMGAGRDLFGLRKDGKEVPIEIGLNPIPTAEGTMILASIVDITERKRIEEALHAAKSIAEEANRAKDHFLAVLSHELRTPLTPIFAAVSMLQRDASLDPDMRDNLEMIRRNVELEARLIDDLLDVVRITRGKIELDLRPVGLTEVIRRAVEVCQSDIEARGVHFGVDIGPEAPYQLEADAARMQQVVWNLLKNAVKFTPPGGCVGIRCRRVNGNGSVMVEINDSGDGIPPEMITRIFQPFEQGGRDITRRYGGLGLGLAISKALVELHGGSISVASEGPGKGSSFRLVLPLAAHGAKAQEEASPAPGRAARMQPLRILLVEDHVDTARIMRRLLSRDGHEVRVAGDVATAMDAVRSWDFDLLISDLGLPDRSGMELMRDVRTIKPHIPGIAVSGYGAAEDLNRSREAGFVEHLVKPIDPARLEDVIRRVGKERDESARVSKPQG